jgi:hypothetical protein
MTTGARKAVLDPLPDAARLATQLQYSVRAAEQPATPSEILPGQRPGLMDALH